MGIGHEYLQLKRQLHAQSWVQNFETPVTATMRQTIGYMPLQEAPKDQFRQRAYSRSEGLEP